MLKSQHLTKLNEEFERLKSLVKHPRLYLRMYFQALKNELEDLNMSHTEKKLFIERISLFESECFHLNLAEINDSSETNEQLKRFKAILININENDYALLDGMQESIEHEVFKLEKLFFNNKTIFLKDRKLIIINNMYLGRHLMESFKTEK